MSRCGARDNGFINPAAAVLVSNLQEPPADAVPIQHALQPEGQLKLFELLGNGPSNSATEKLMSAEQLQANCASPQRT